MSWHVAIIHPDLSQEYVGEVEDPLQQEIRSIGEIDGATRVTKMFEDKDDEFYVLRDDGLLEWYCQDGYTPREERQIDAVDVDVPEELAGPEGASSGPTYISGVERLGKQSIGGAMDYPGNPARAVWHTTECPSGSGWFTSMASYLISVSFEPQVLYDPVSDRLGQFGPLNQSARALQNESNGRRTNREGRVCIQTEVVGQASKPFTNSWDPSKKPNFQKLCAAQAAWGVPNKWPAGSPPDSQHTHSRSASLWHGTGGHYSHADIPGNTHWDPGAIDIKKVPYGGGSTGSTTTTPARYQVTINGLKYGYGATGSQVTKVGTALVKKGFGKHYSVGPGPTWSDSDTLNYQDFQKSLGYTGSDADGVPGESSLKKLLGTLPSATYTVVKGDTLTGIGKKLGIEWQKLASANGLKAPYVIQPGEVLKVPN